MEINRHISHDPRLHHYGIFCAPFGLIILLPLRQHTAKTDDADCNAERIVELCAKNNYASICVQTVAAHVNVYC